VPEWKEYISKNRVPEDVQSAIITHMKLYNKDLPLIQSNNSNQNSQRQNLLERYLDLQHDPIYLRNEVYEARRYMLSRESLPITQQDDNYGLVVGRIQSGKTAHMLGLAMACIENQEEMTEDYIRGSSSTKLVIIFSSLIDDIRIQTLDRLRKCLPKDRIESILIGPDSSADFATNSNFQTVFYDFLNGERKERSAILVLKKQHSVIDHLLRVINKVNHPWRKFKGDVLIVDDECDYGSQDGNNADQDQSANETAINERLRLTIQLFRTKYRAKCWYIGYTATPYCNVLMYPPGEANGMKNLFPRGFIYTTNKHRSHFDNSFYFGTDEGESFLREPGESDLILDDYDNRLVEFLLLHIITRIIKSNRIDDGFHHTSMINNAISVRDHASTLDEIVRISNELRTLINDSASEFREYINQFTFDFFSSNPNYEEIYSVISRTDIGRFSDELNKIQYIELNRRDSELDDDLIAEDSIYPQEVPYPEIPRGNEGHSYIVTGGARISRGLTLEGLTISLFTRQAQQPNYDTMLQMSRWCGFRNDYEDLVKILVPTNLVDDFRHINEAEIQLRTQLNRIQPGEDPTMADIWILAHERMNPTGKMPNREFLEHATTYINGILKQVFWFQHPVDLVSKGSNIRPFNELFNKITRHSEWNSTNDETWGGFYINHSVSNDIVSTFLRKYISNTQKLEVKTELDREAIHYIDSILNSFPDWNVAIASPNGSKKHSVPGNDIDITLSKRTPNSNGFIQRIYSNYERSIHADLVDKTLPRTIPLILIYLVDTSTKYPNSDKYCYVQRATPSVQLGIVLPDIITPGRVITWVHGARDNPPSPPQLLEEE